MKGRYAGVSMSVYGAILPGTARLARLPAEPSAEATRRWKVVQWHREHGACLRKTGRHFTLSPDTVSRWVGAETAHGVGGLEPKSRRPRRVRQPTTPTEVVLAIQRAREAHPRWGREKLRVLLVQEGVRISAKSIDRVLRRLRARGVLVEPKVVRTGLQAAARRRPRRPADLVVDRPGVLVQVDCKQVAVAPGSVVFEFGAIDCFTRQRVVQLYPKQHSRAGAQFLEQVVQAFPFPIQAIQTDGGSEFLGEFGPKVAQLGLVQYWNRPNYPQGNGRIERSFGTDEREFWQVEELPGDLAGLRAALAAWDHVYHTERPHQALGYRTPDQFYQEWLATHPKPAPSTERRVVSDMS